MQEIKLFSPCALMTTEGSKDFKPGTYDIQKYNIILGHWFLTGLIEAGKAEWIKSSAKPKYKPLPEPVVKPVIVEEEKKVTFAKVVGEEVEELFPETKSEEVEEEEEEKPEPEPVEVKVKSKLKKKK